LERTTAAHLLEICGIFVPLNFQLTASSIEYALNHSESKILVCDEEFVPVIKALLPKLTSIHFVIVVGGKSSRDRVLSFNEVLSREKDRELSISLNHDDTAIFLYTAGTTGDLGYVDEDGYVHIVDRKKDIIIRGGENISSMEVEEMLHAHPGVLEASALGAPDAVLGETVMAVVVSKPGSDLSEQALIHFCEEHLERFKVPTRVEFVEELPRNAGGKVLKRQLRIKYFGPHDA
jgi:acyl-CoA synthetase (AMP-forming)/AMP-acid ligase II